MQGKQGKKVSRVVKKKKKAKNDSASNETSGGKQQNGTKRHQVSKRGKSGKKLESENIRVEFRPRKCHVMQMTKKGWFGADCASAVGNECSEMV